MDLRNFSIDEYKEMQEDLIGSLVSLYSFDDDTGIRLTGKGLILNLRREHGQVFAKVAWTNTPYYRFIDVRKVGWHSIERLFILQNKFGAKNYAYQSKDSQ